MNQLLGRVRERSRLARRPAWEQVAHPGCFADAGARTCCLCAEPLASAHRHLLEPEARRLRCTCRGCALVLERDCFDTDVCRLVPERLWRLDDLVFDDREWDWLGIPPGLAFATEGADGEVIAWHPDPFGGREIRLERSRWRQLLARHPALRTLEPGVEVLLALRRGTARDHWIAPVDVCLRLVACAGTHWRGADGGELAWREIDALLAELRRDALTVRRADVEPRGRARGAVTP